MTDKAIPICCRCHKPAIANSVEDKMFWYCRTCKIEIDDTGWEVKKVRKREDTDFWDAFEFDMEEIYL